MSTPLALSRRRSRALLLTTVVGIVLIVAFALVLSVALGTRRITTAAEALHDANEALRQATTVRAHLALSVIVANVDRELGTNSVENLETARTESMTALREFAEGIDQLRADRELSQSFFVAVDGFEEASNQVLDLLEAGDSRAARSVAESSLNDAFASLQDHLVAERSELDSVVSSADERLAWLGNVTRFLVAFLVPTAVIMVYRELARRQQRQIELEGKLQAERALGKAREDFIANTSHELRTPLTSIYGLALLLEEDPAFVESSTALELVDMLVSESADLSRMVEDLLTTARLDAQALHYTFENVAVLDEIREVMAPMLRAGTEVEVDSEPAVIRVDRLRFRQILRNLLSNAQKYGGKQIRVEGRATKGKFVVAVADNGAGIPDTVEQRLFQRFLHHRQQPHMLGSVGLGLSIVHALAEGMGGSVIYQRNDGWTRFVVALPLVGLVPQQVSETEEGLHSSPRADVPGLVGLNVAEEHQGWPT